LLALANIPVTFQIDNDPSRWYPGAFMRIVFLARAHFPCLIFLTVIILAISMTPASYADTLQKLRAGLPEQIKGWTVKTEDRIFDEKTIFDYINGAGEVYRAYNMRQCLSRRYTTSKGPAIVLDIFDMGSSKDAFGVFTHDTDGEVVNVGQDARYRPGWLSFWKDRFFVSIYMEEETDAAEKAVRELGRQVATLIPTQGARPRILSQLPAAGLKAESICYLHHPVVLNYHFYISDENILNIAPNTDAVLANYEQGGEKARLLLVIYPDPDIAKKSLANFIKHYLPEADPTGTALLENGKWTATFLKQQLLAVVLEADSQQMALNLLKSVKASTVIRGARSHD
jgi:hypothetical protein